MRVEGSIATHGYTEAFYFTVIVINPISKPPLFKETLKD